MVIIANSATFDNIGFAFRFTTAFYFVKVPTSPLCDFMRGGKFLHDMQSSQESQVERKGTNERWTILR